MTRSFRCRALCFTIISAAALALGAAECRGENWPQWRGARFDGISSETGLPTSWSPTENVAWRLALPGPSGATPVVWEDRIFLTSTDSADLILMCVSTSGKELWRKKMASGNRAVRNDEGNFASNSPCTDGKHVWAMMSEGTIGCYTADGEEVWKFNLQDRYGRFDIQYGMASSPALDQGRLYLQLLHGDGKADTHEAVVVCLDAASGKELWKSDRVTGAHTENEHSYASPVIYRDKEREFLLTHGADFAIAYDLKSGKELWRCGDLNPHGRYHPTLRFVTSPLAVDGQIILPTAKKGAIFSVRPDGKGDVSQDEKRFHWRKFSGTPDVPSPLIHDGLLYLCLEDSVLRCWEAATGEQIYEKRLDDFKQRASPVYADGKIYCVSRDGSVSVVKAGREFELLAKNEMQEHISASPAISGGRIYLRTYDALYAIGK